MHNHSLIAYFLEDKLPGAVVPWVQKLKASFHMHSRYELTLLNWTGNHEGDEVCDFNIHNSEEARAVLRKLSPVIVIPNHLWAIYRQDLPDTKLVSLSYPGADETYFTQLRENQSRIAKFVVLNAREKQDLTARLPHRAPDIILLPAAINVPESLERSYQVRPIRMLYGSPSDEEQSGTFTLIPLVQNLLKFGTDFCLTIIGDVGDASQVEDVLARAVAEERVRFLGRLDREEMDRIWSEQDLYIQTADAELGSHDVIAAMAQGVVPLVPSGEDSLSSVVKHAENGLIFPSGEMEALAFTVDFLSKKFDLLTRLGQEAHQSAPLYAMQPAVNSLSRLFDEMRDMRSPTKTPSRIANIVGAIKFARKESKSLLNAEVLSRESTLYLHIGLHKTGTTAIQHFLYENRDILRQRNYLYPVSGVISAAHHPLAWSLNEGHPNHKKLNSSPAEIWARIGEEIEESGCEHTILSSEDLSVIYEDEKLEKLRLLTEAYQTKIVVYLRRQDQLYQSQYKQMVRERTARYSESVQEFGQNRTWIWHFLDFEKRLTKWETIFGRENIIVRVYEKSQMSNGIFADFFDAVGLSYTDEYSLPEYFNQTLNRDVLEFLRYWNAVPHSETDHFKLITALKKISDKIDNRNYFEHHNLLSPKERLDILQKYDESNRRIAQKYLGRQDGRLFIEPWPDPNEEWNPYPGLSIEKLTQIMVELWVEQQRDIDALRQKIDI